MALILHPSNAETATFTSGPVNTRNREYAGLFVNVTAISGTSPTLLVKLQESADNVGWADVPSFATASLTATGCVRVAPAATAQKCADYVRAVCTVGGTTPSVTFTAHLATTDIGIS